VHWIGMLFNLHFNFFLSCVCPVNITSPFFGIRLSVLVEKLIMLYMGSATTGTSLCSFLHRLFSASMCFPCLPCTLKF
jgi:hypothetical protein